MRRLRGVGQLRRGVRRASAADAGGRPTTTGCSRIGWRQPARRSRRSTARPPPRATTNSARCAGCWVTSTARRRFRPGAVLGMDPQPGEALLRCAQGDGERAWTRPAVRAGRRGPARRGCDCCVGPSRWRWPATASRRPNGIARTGIRCRSVRHSRLSRLGRARPRGDPGAAGTARCGARALQAALREYRTQQSRYETAQVYEWMAIAHKGLGDDELAAADTATAENIYAQLGVEPARVCGSAAPGGLTKREIEILRCVAAGATNRQVAEQICISEKTVAGTWPTSTPSWGFRHGPRQWRGRTKTTWCSGICTICTTSAPRNYIVWPMRPQARAA